MSDVTVDTDEAVDAFTSLCDAAVDYDKLTRELRRAKRRGKEFETQRAGEILFALLNEMMNDAALLSQGDDEDRITLCKRVAERVVERIQQP